MTASLSGKAVAIVVCSGFEEKPFVELQRALTEAGAKASIVSRDTGVTNGWSGADWGLSYPVDNHLSDTLAVDYDAVVIPDGKRHTDLLLAEAHGKRVINAFLREDAPTLAIGSAVSMIGELGFGGGEAPEAVTLENNLVVAPAGASIAEMVDNFALAVGNWSEKEEAA